MVDKLVCRLMVYSFVYFIKGGHFMRSGLSRIGSLLEWTSGNYHRPFLKCSVKRGGKYDIKK